jgi:hypothetical protein
MPASMSESEAAMPDEACERVSVEVSLAGASASSRKATVRTVLQSLLTQSGVLINGERDQVIGEPQSAVDELRETLKKTKRNSGGELHISEPGSILCAPIHRHL